MGGQAARQWQYACITELPITEKPDVRTHRYKLLEADLLVFVGVPGDEGLDDLSHLVAWQGQTGLLEKLLKLKVAHVAAVVDI